MQIPRHSSLSRVPLSVPYLLLAYLVVQWLCLYVLVREFTGAMGGRVGLLGHMVNKNTKTPPASYFWLYVSLSIIFLSLSATRTAQLSNRDIIDDPCLRLRYSTINHVGDDR